MAGHAAVPNFPTPSEENDVTSVFILGLVAVTSLCGYLVGVRGLGLPAGALGRALVHAIEALGATLAFTLVNIVIGTAAVVAWRSLTPWFASAYIVGDDSLLVLSLLQGLTFSWWRIARARA